jgi:hypothetical protein
MFQNKLLSYIRNFHTGTGNKVTLGCLQAIEGNIYYVLRHINV